VPALLAAMGSVASARAAAPPEVRITVDATAPGSALTPVWTYFGYDEANYTTTQEGKALLSALAKAQAMPVHVRTHFLFNTGDGTPALKWGSTNLYTEDGAGNPVYSYTLIDQIMDTMVEAETVPFVELGFMPEALSTQPDPYRNSGTYTLDGGCFYPPKDYERWAGLITAWASHVKERYAASDMNWQWELWNEPDIAYWQGTFDEYAALYDYTEAALHGVLPRAELGGPAVTNPNNDFLSQFLEHCATGTNAVTGQTGTRLDLVSFHAKGGVTVADDHVQMQFGNQLRLHRKGFETAMSFEPFAHLPIVISEADPDGCAACLPSVWPEYAYRTSPAYGAYEVAMMKRSLELAERMDITLQGVLTWAFTFPDSPYFAGYRALATGGVHLPVFNAFALLGSLRGDRLPVDSSGALPLDDILNDSVRGQPDVDALATSDGKRIQILVWNYHDDLVDVPETPVTLEVSVPPAFGASVTLTHTRVDEQHGDAYTVWQSQGSPETPTEAELDELREAMRPAQLESARSVPVNHGTVSVAFDLPRFGLSLVTLEPSGEPSAAARPTDQAGCSCRLPRPVPTRHASLLVVLCFGGLLVLRRLAPHRISA
jgi:xylan 1,4-beta-xylosidase